ncbi:hypothetical protein SCARR_00803 [Pontiella sulfatireligans]|uniref:Uncharacterized protein n=1 Tax=Pontiella sulfatireligans TaxID=2750658 RepID=A0A6C2UEZ7_9BACT|nr:hypothetical protein SCARR_00803 [Pontiella sulfatireligans]
MRESIAKQTQWSAFCKKSKLRTCPESFSDLLNELFEFLLPLAKEIESDNSVHGHWTPEHGWTA